MDDKRIRQIAEGTYAKGDYTNLVRHLCKELLAERTSFRIAFDQLVRWRSRALELQNNSVNLGRVLIVDAPPPRDDMRELNGEMVIYHDKSIAFRYVKLDVPYAAQNFEAALEAELKGQFRGMPWELSSRYETVWSRWIA